MAITYTLAQLAEKTHCQLRGNPAQRISYVCNLEDATEEAISFFANDRYHEALKNSRAGAIFIKEGSPLINDQKNFLLAQDPSAAFQIVVELFLGPPCFTLFEGIHPTAIIHPTAKIEKNVTIGPYTVIDGHVTIGEGSTLGSHCFIGPYSTLGAHCRIHPHVTIREKSLIGNYVEIQPGAVIGACGFGYLTDARGAHTKLNQLGQVVIKDKVDVGANTTIDRSRFEKTLIDEGSKIDNLVQVGHGASIGPHNLIVAQVGIAGSTRTGRHVILAGQVGVAGHLEIGDGVIVTAQSGVSKSLKNAGPYGGSPAMPMQEYNRWLVQLRHIGKLFESLKKFHNKKGD